MAEADQHECTQLDRFSRIEADVDRLDNYIRGNGGGGMREELAELRTSIRAMARVWWIVLGAVCANLVAVVYRVLQ